MSVYAYKVRSWGAAWALDFIIDGRVTASIPFSNRDEAGSFGADWLRRNDVESAIIRHPAGRRLVEPHAEAV